jgi:hypothetical protein
MANRDLTRSTALLVQYAGEREDILLEIERTRQKLQNRLQLLAEDLSALDERIEEAKRSRIPQLNHDTISRVLDFLVPIESRYREIRPISLFLRLCLLCKTWSQPARRCLYREIHIRPTNIAPFIRTVKSSRDIRPYVRLIYVSVKDYGADWRDTVQLLPNCSLRVSGRYSDRDHDEDPTQYFLPSDVGAPYVGTPFSLGPLGKLAALHIGMDDLVWPSSAWVQLFRSAHRLEDLRCQGSLILPTAYNMIPEVNTAEFLPALHHLKFSWMTSPTPPPTSPNTLHTLIILHCTSVDTVPFLQCVEHHSNSLKTLELAFVNFVGDDASQIIDKAVASAVHLEVAILRSPEHVSAAVLRNFSPFLQRLEICPPSVASADAWIRFLRYQVTGTTVKLEKLGLWSDATWRVGADLYSVHEVAEELGLHVWALYVDRGFELDVWV